MKKLSWAGLLASLLLLTSCLNRGGDGEKYIRYVGTVLNDTSAVGYHILRAYDPSDKYGPIAVIGSPDEALPYLEAFLTADHFNNIDGHEKPDGLPDFSGELIEGILDMANGPYVGYLRNDNRKYLQEVGVRNFISALDTNYLYSPYDKNQLEYKRAAKMVVYGSTYAAVYGAPDADTLCRLSGIPVPVISPVNCMLDEVFQRSAIKNHLCVWTTEDKAQSGLYEDAYERYRHENGLKEAPQLLVYAPDIYVNPERRFLDILDLYLEADYVDHLSYMMVDDPDIDLEQLKQYVLNIKKDKDESRLAYRNLLSDDFTFITPVNAVVKKVFHLMRESNIFTHAVSYPVFRGYMTFPDNDLNVSDYSDEGSFTDDFKYHRADGTMDDTWDLILMRDRYISEELSALIERLAPKIINEYVHQ